MKRRLFSILLTLTVALTFTAMAVVSVSAASKTSIKVMSKTVSKIGPVTISTTYKYTKQGRLASYTQKLTYDGSQLAKYKFTPKYKKGKIASGTLAISDGIKMNNQITLNKMQHSTHWKIGDKSDGNEVKYRYKKKILSSFDSISYMSESAEPDSLHLKLGKLKAKGKTATVKYTASYSSNGEVHKFKGKTTIRMTKKKNGVATSFQSVDDGKNRVKTTLKYKTMKVSKKVAKNLKMARRFTKDVAVETHYGYLN